METFLRDHLRNICMRESQNQDTLKSLKLRMSWTAKELSLSAKRG